jgi:hypothetical protein
LRGDDESVGQNELQWCVACKHQLKLNEFDQMSTQCFFLLPHEKLSDLSASYLILAGDVCYISQMENICSLSL